MTLANALSILRLVLAPGVVYAILTGQDLVVLALLAGAAVTDVLDGWVARSTGKVSRLGIVLDPIADKMVIGAALLGSALIGRLPAWLVWVYLLKELAVVSGAAVFFVRLGAPIKSNRYGKTSTAVTFAGLFLLWRGVRAGWWVVLAGLVIGIAAALSYLRIGLHEERAKGA
ncbi:MAG: CDP-alcohol phosphatidyltransferase family protein [Bacteroidota bacterium]